MAAKICTPLNLLPPWKATLRCEYGAINVNSCYHYHDKVSLLKHCTKHYRYIRLFISSNYKVIIVSSFVNKNAENQRAGVLHRAIELKAEQLWDFQQLGSFIHVRVRSVAQRGHGL